MKQNKLGFALKLTIPIVLVISIFIAGFVSLDQKIIPKNFSKYDINNIGDVVSVISSLYGTKKEYKNASANYSTDDYNNTVSKLQTAGYKIENDGTVLESNFQSFKGSEKIILNSTELSAILVCLQKNGVAKQNYKTISYFGAENIEILKFEISPIEESFDAENQTYTQANISIRLKINTEKMKKQIASQMETTEALLNLIWPGSLYFDVNFSIDLNLDEKVSDTKIFINSKPAHKGDKLINLLVDFIFPKTDEMTYNDFSNSLSDIVYQSFLALGEFKFVKNIDNSNLNGIIFN